MNKSAYAKAGVDIDAGNRAVELMRGAVRSTYGPEVLLGIGAFGGLFDASALRDMAQPVLVGSTDGVGTKTMVATALGSFETLGQDIVNHCIDDILVQGASPLFPGLCCGAQTHAREHRCCSVWCGYGLPRGRLRHSGW